MLPAVVFPVSIVASTCLCLSLGSTVALLALWALGLPTSKFSTEGSVGIDALSPVVLAVTGF